MPTPTPDPSPQGGGEKNARTRIRILLAVLLLAPASAAIAASDRQPAPPGHFPGAPAQFSAAVLERGFTHWPSDRPVLLTFSALTIDICPEYGQ
jgi:hypothetical protein